MSVEPDESERDEATEPAEEAPTSEAPAADEGGERRDPGPVTDAPPRASRPPEGAARDEEDEGRRRQRRRLEGALRESFRRAVEKGLEAGLGAIESSVDVLEKGVEAGRGTFHQASSSLKGVVDDVKMPKEVASYVFAQVDETKNVLIRAVAREVRDFLDATDLAHELQRALTSLSFEIKTEIRFIPNEKGIVKAEVKSKAGPHRVDGAANEDDDEPAPEGSRRKRRRDG